jgi:hypothetical protein
MFLITDLIYISIDQCALSRSISRNASRRVKTCSNMLP